MHSHELDYNKVPQLYKGSYIGKIKRNVFIHQPLSSHRVVVLSPWASRIFSQIDNKKTIQDIGEIVKVGHDEVSRCLLEFISAQIIHLGNPVEFIEKYNRSLHVWLHITNQCNLRCNYCYIVKSSKKMPHKLLSIAINNIFSSAKRNEKNYISFRIAGGEPLLELPTVVKAVTQIKLLEKEYGITTPIKIITNGTLITPRVSRILKEMGVDVSVSLDGIGKFNGGRRFANNRSSYKYVKQGIENLLKNEVAFRVSSVIQEKNLPGFPALVKYFLSNDINFRLALFRDNSCANTVRLDNHREVIDTLKRVFKIIERNYPKRSLLTIFEDFFTNTPRIYSCGYGRNLLAVGCDGTISSCQMTMGSGIGSIINDDPVESIITSNRIDPKVVSVDKKGLCGQCIWKYTCTGGCPVLTKWKKGRYSLNSPNCDIYKAIIPEILRLEAKRLLTINSDKPSLLWW